LTLLVKGLPHGVEDRLALAPHPNTKLVGGEECGGPVCCSHGSILGHQPLQVVPDCYWPHAPSFFLAAWRRGLQKKGATCCGTSPTSIL
jgi:hypothetical protein